MRDALMREDFSHWVIDVNVLVNAYIAQTSAQRLCKKWLEISLQKPNMKLWLPTATKLGFVRLLGCGIVTQQPEPFALLHDYLDLLAQHGVKEATPGANHATFWRIATGLIQTKGNDVTDSHMVAVALELNASLVTCDKGFGRFVETMGLKVFDPTQLHTT